MASSINIPKVIRKVSEKKFGRTWRWIWISVISIGFIIIMLMLSNFAPWRVKIVMWALVLAYIVFFFKFLKSDETLDRSILMWNYFMRSMRGQTMIAKYTCSVPFLQQIVPIVSVHNEGIIQFTENRWGILINSDPDRVIDDELDAHIMKVKDVVDSLFGDLVLKTFVCSRKNSAKPVEQDIVKKMNDPEKTIPQKQHLHSIYQDIRGNTKPQIDWVFYIFLSLGIYATVEEAQQARQTHLPGFESRLRASGMHVVQMTDPNEIAMCYRQCVTQLKLKDNI